MSSSDPIVITKENDGDMINFFEESSEGSAADVQIRRPVMRNNKRRSRNAPTTSNRAPPLPHQSEKPAKPPPLNDNMFEVFTNPDKKRIESDEESDEQMGYPNNNPDEDPDDDYPNPPQYEDEAAPTEPSAGFSSIEDEKQDLLYKFYRLTSKGIPVGKKFTMNSDIHEMRHEFSRIQRDNDVKSSIRFSRRMLMACVTGIEFLNKRYDPFEVKLDGWSESIMENMDDYDNVFERLHDKYASRVSMAPEIELLLSLAGSAFMFNLTNSMFNSMPNLKDIAKQNPDILKNLMQSIQNANTNNTTNNDTNNNTNTTTKEDPPQQQQQRNHTSTSQPPPPLARGNNQNTNKAREMKPPAFDMSSLFESMPMVPVGNATFPIASRETDRSSNSNIIEPIISNAKRPILKRSNSGSSLSSLSGMSGHSLPNTLKIVSIDTSQASKSRGRRKNKITATKQNTISI